MHCRETHSPKDLLAWITAGISAKVTVAQTTHFWENRMIEREKMGIKGRKKSKKKRVTNGEKR